MELHLDLATDAAAEFIEGFRAYERLGSTRSARTATLQAARALRSLYIAIEKALKGVLLEANPYLLVEKLDSKVLLALVKDAEARPVQSPLLCRVPFETPSLVKCWESVRQLRAAGLPTEDVDAFEKSLKRFADLRHRAQHGEFHEDRAELLAVLEQVLQGVRLVLQPLAPEFYGAIARRNTQIDPRLRAIEERIDAAWSVLLEYLDARGGIDLRMEFVVSQRGPTQPLRILIRQSSDAYMADLMMVPEVALHNATGIFTRWITPDEARSRNLERTFELLPTPPRRGGSGPAAGIAPLEEGSLTIARESGWLTIRLPGSRPSRLNLRVFMPQFLLKLPDPVSPLGTVSALMIGPVRAGANVAPAVTLTGAATLTREFALGAFSEDYPEGVTVRELDLKLRMATTPATIVKQSA